MATEMREIVRHAQALVEATSGEVDDKIAKVRESLKERLNAATEAYAELGCHFGDKIKAADQLVREKPYHAMGGGLLMGLLLGWLITRK
jgi:ElaB/YqjD/DUF883 family membrane-anchored ribosome-binding protein